MQLPTLQLVMSQPGPAQPGMSLLYLFFFFLFFFCLVSLASGLLFMLTGKREVFRLTGLEKNSYNCLDQEPCTSIQTLFQSNYVVLPGVALYIVSCLHYGSVVTQQKYYMPCRGMLQTALFKGCVQMLVAELLIQEVGVNPISDQVCFPLRSSPTGLALS